MSREVIYSWTDISGDGVIRRAGASILLVNINVQVDFLVQTWSQAQESKNQQEQYLTLQKSNLSVRQIGTTSETWTEIGIFYAL